VYFSQNCEKALKFEMAAVATEKASRLGLVSRSFRFWRPDGLVDDDGREPISEDVRPTTFGVQVMDMVRFRVDALLMARRSLALCGCRLERPLASGYSTWL
jgi:hypothetical protein